MTVCPQRAHVLVFASCVPTRLTSFAAQIRFEQHEINISNVAMTFTRVKRVDAPYVTSLLGFELVLAAE